MTIPAKLRDFFVEFGYLSISYKTRDGVSEYYSIDPRMDFCNWNKDDFQDFFIDYDITGMAYPVGFACRDNLTVYYHDDGHFYLYLSGGPLHRCRQSGEFF